MEGTSCTRGNTTARELKIAILPVSELTWLVQTLLNVTNANVCASIVDGKSFLAKAKGIMTALRSICGMKARRSSCRDGRSWGLEIAFGEELRYSRVL
jgi:hypothetical protein